MSTKTCKMLNKLFFIFLRDKPALLTASAAQATATGYISMSGLDFASVLWKCGEQ